MDKHQSSVGDHLIKTKSKESKQKADVSKGHKCLNVDLGEDTLLSICDTFLEILDDIQVNSNLLLQKLYDVHISLKSKLLTVKGINEENTDTLPFENTDLLNTFSSSSWSINSGASGLMEDYSDFKKFMTEVICPFCSKSQTDKINFIKHLDESCTPSLNDEFQERRVIPFSAFQILPNNTIKCNVCFNSVSRNIKSFFAHMLTKNHTLNFKKAKKSKDVTDFLFCSVCKVLVPDTYTQLNHHMKSEVHRSRSTEAPNYSKSSGCVYMKNKKFKCMECPGKNIYHNSKDILQHFEDPKHKKHMKGRFPVIFCEVCDEIIHVFKLVIHFSSKEHAAREKALPLEDWYELCFYCGFSCGTLKELSQHMKMQCSVIFSMRLKIPEITTKSEMRNNKVTEEANLKEPVSSRNSYVSVEIKKEQVASENLSKEENSRESSHVIVKDNTDVVGVYQFFEKFGEITEVQIYKEKNLLIRFKEKCAVDSVLRLRDKILIKGVKADITTEEELKKPTKKAEKSKNKDLFQTVNMPIEPTTYNEVEKEKLKELFNRVSTHLSTTKKTSNFSLEQKILKDCDLIFGEKKCSLVGFSGCGLAFPVENISLFSNFTEEFAGILRNDFHEKFVNNFCAKLYGSGKWEICNIDSLLNIECKHKETQKMCTFTFMPSAGFLTQMLRTFMAVSREMEGFCLIVRFWLCVHELNLRRFEFATISLIIFFSMQSKSFSNCFFSMPDKIKPFYKILNGEIESKKFLVKHYIYNDIFTMFRSFLEFLDEFDFNNNAICLPVKYAVPKTFFQKYECSKFLTSVEPYQIMSSPMCILDPFLCFNLSSSLNEKDLELILEAVRTTHENSV